MLSVIDQDHRIRTDTNKKLFTLFSRSSKERIFPGSIVRVDFQQTQTTKKSYVGVLIAIRRKGISSTIKLRFNVLKSPVELVFPIYSPKILDIEVLRQNDLFKDKGKGYFMRNEPDEYDYSKKTVAKLKKLYSRVDDLNKVLDWQAREAARQASGKNAAKKK